jgi:hypothetical protein
MNDDRFFWRFIAFNIPTFLPPKEPFAVKGGMSSIADNNFGVISHG